MLTESSRTLFRSIFHSALFAAVVAAPLARAQNQDPKAVEVAHRMMKAMGGADAWNNTHFVRFDFRVGQNGEYRVDRAHLWDKWNGRYRLEQKTKEGKMQVVLFNVNDKKGSVYMDGAKLSDADAAEPLTQAYGAFINDMYWLAMPWKWLDQGVHLQYAGEKEQAGEMCDVVELSFANVGLTPGDHYRAFVSKASGLMTHWEYTLQSGNTGSWDWKYADTGGIKLAATHTNAEGMEINMGRVEAMSEADPAYFTDPAKMLR